MNNKTSILVLDVHNTAIDITVTGSWYRKAYPRARIVMPFAGYLFYFPLVTWILKLWAQRSNIEIYPVFRKEEDTPTTRAMKLAILLYPKSLTKEQKKECNLRYIAAAEATLQQGNGIVIVSPYGGTARLGGNIKKGVHKLLSLAQDSHLSYSRITLFSTKTSSMSLEKNTTTLKTDLHRLFLELIQSAR